MLLTETTVTRLTPATKLTNYKLKLTTTLQLKFKLRGRKPSLHNNNNNYYYYYRVQYDPDQQQQI